MRTFTQLTAQELEEKWAEESKQFRAMEDSYQRLERVYSRLAEIENVLWILVNRKK